MTVELAVNPEVGRNDEVAPVGVVLYDNPEAPEEGGWASLDGSDSYRVRGIPDLQSDAVWITNTSAMAFSQSRQSSVHNVRQDAFFRTTLKQIVSDFGYRSEQFRGPDQAKLLSEISKRVVAIAGRVYVWPSGLSLAGRNLGENIRALMPSDGQTPQNVRPMLMAAFQKDSMVPTPWSESQIPVSLRFNRTKHARKILSTPVPGASWEWVETKDLPSDQGRRLDFLLNSDRPVMVEASVSFDRVDSDTAALVAFGVTFSRNRGVRRWISHPELVWLSKFARIDILSAVIGSEYKLLPKNYQLPISITQDPMMLSSYSAGLVAEAHWTCLSSEVWSPKGRTTEVCPRAVWLRATDRAICFFAAKRAQEAGFMVSGYGNGSVNLRVDNSLDGFERLHAFAAKELAIAPVVQNMVKYVDG